MSSDTFKVTQEGLSSLLLRLAVGSCCMDLVTVFDAIFTSRQTREKLQCLYENLMSSNFRKTALLKKICFVN